MCTYTVTGTANSCSVLCFSVVWVFFVFTSDPYHVSPRDRRGSGRGRFGRPPTVKDHDLQNMDADDDDEGWAGHHEEVDYTKEVVFEDSSDDESNGDKRDQLAASRQHSEVPILFALGGC